MTTLADLEPRQRRRLVLRSTMRIFGITFLLVTAYFVAPLQPRPDVTTTVRVLGALTMLGVAMTWQLRAVANARFPQVRAAEGIVTLIVLVLVVFAGVYASMSLSQPHAFSQSLTRTSALYFTVVTFATVGFGDIVPTTDPARVAVTVQIVTNLVLLGGGVRILTAAATAGTRRERETET